MALKDRLLKVDGYAQVPLKWIGPLKITGQFNQTLKVPLATYESPLWPSVERGARITEKAGGIHVVAGSRNMSRSVCVQAKDAASTQKIIAEVTNNQNELKSIVKQTSNFAEFQSITAENVGNLIYFRILIHPKDASGHNMATKAAEAILHFLLEKYASLKYISVSGNYCTDKKVSAVNGIAGRGQRVTADVVIDQKLCQKMLRSSPEKITELVYKKNYIGSTLAGSLRSANAHFANILLAFYLATGQDAANIIEGSQGFTFAEVQNTNLYFSVTLPNIIVGTVGNGKDLDFVVKNLKALACLNAEQLACIIAASVLCGELSLLAALTNNGELINTHMKLER